MNEPVIPQLIHKGLENEIKLQIKNTASPLFSP